MGKIVGKLTIVLGLLAGILILFMMPSSSSTIPGMRTLFWSWALGIAASGVVLGTFLIELGNCSYLLHELVKMKCKEEQGKGMTQQNIQPRRSSWRGHAGKLPQWYQKHF